MTTRKPQSARLDLDPENDGTTETQQEGKPPVGPGSAEEQTPVKPLKVPKGTHKLFRLRQDIRLRNRNGAFVVLLKDRVISEGAYDVPYLRSQGAKLDEVKACEFCAETMALKEYSEHLVKCQKEHAEG